MPYILKYDSSDYPYYIVSKHVSTIRKELAKRYKRIENAQTARLRAEQFKKIKVVIIDVKQ